MDTLNIEIALLIGIPLGLLWGRIVNRLIQQLPLRLQLFGTMTYCHHCHHDPTLGERLPLLGFIQTRGQCPQCSEPLDRRPFFVELFFVLVSVLLLATLAPLQALHVLAVLGILLAAATIDLSHWIIPDVLVFVSLGLALLGLLLGQIPMDQALMGLGVMALAMGFNMLLHFTFFKEAGLGWGDVKLALALSIWLGPILSVFMLFIAAALALIVWISVGIRLGFTRKRPLQFGPFIALASVGFGIARAYDPLLITHLLTF